MSIKHIKGFIKDEPVAKNYPGDNGPTLADLMAPNISQRMMQYNSQILKQLPPNQDVVEVKLTGGKIAMDYRIMVKMNIVTITFIDNVYSYSITHFGPPGGSLKLTMDRMVNLYWRLRLEGYKSASSDNMMILITKTERTFSNIAPVMDRRQNMMASLLGDEPVKSSLPTQQDACGKSSIDGFFMTNSSDAEEYPQDIICNGLFPYSSTLEEAFNKIFNVEDVIQYAEEAKIRLATDKKAAIQEQLESLKSKQDKLQQQLQDLDEE